MTISRYLIVLVVASVLTGCSMADLTSSIKGNYYIETGDYAAAEETFRQIVKNYPDNATNHYYLGRFLLAQDKIPEALRHLQKAVGIDKNDKDDDNSESIQTEVSDNLTEVNLKRHGKFD